MSGGSGHIRPGRGAAQVYTPGGAPYLAGTKTAAAEAALPEPQFGDVATDPEQPPFDVIEAPAHLSNQKWQTSFYDATSQAPMGVYVQRPSGPCDITTGELLGEEFASGDVWRQV